MSRLMVLMAAALSLSACAKGADQVLPATIPPADFAGMSCSQLATALLRNREGLAALTAAQNKASDNDSLGVLIIGLPVASMSGADRAPQLAVAKGRDLSLQSMMAAKNCPA